MSVMLRPWLDGARCERPNTVETVRTVSVDIWALGIIMYGLLDGRFPFKDENDIKTKEPKFPRRLEPLCQDFISAMLQKDEEHRASADEIMVHGWLHQTDDGITPKQRSDSKEGAGSRAASRGAGAWLVRSAPIHDVHVGSE
eukprot:Skav220868  [mRNA]  locus=scaffold1331:45552:50405:+ [translate_table: standard]